MCNIKNKKGFTLTEILATIVILGIILAIAAKTYCKEKPDKTPKE